MHYEINVSRFIRGKYVHWFATHERSLTTEDEAKELASVFRVSLPGNCKVDVKRIETVGYETSI